MMTNAFDLVPAFILHSRPYRDTSLLIEFFTKFQGRISAIAKGVRKPKSRLSGLLQPFSPLLISCFGKSELLNLRHVEANGLSFQLQHHAFLSSFYCNELLMRILPRGDAYEGIFDAYARLLSELQNQTDGCEKSLRLFEKKVLEELGYGLQLQYETLTGSEIKTNGFYKYDFEQGFIETTVNGTSKIVFQGQHLLNLHHEQFGDADTLRAIKQLMRLALKPLLGDKPLQTRKMFI